MEKDSMVDDGKDELYDFTSAAESGAATETEVYDPENLDLYDDLVVEEGHRQIQSHEELRVKFDKTLSQNDALMAEVERLQQTVQKESTERVILEKNISSLLLTARSELKRKDMEIRNLRIKMKSGYTKQRPPPRTPSGSRTVNKSESQISLDSNFEPLSVSSPLPSDSIHTKARENRWRCSSREENVRTNVGQSGHMDATPPKDNSRTQSGKHVSSSKDRIQTLQHQGSSSEKRDSCVRDYRSSKSPQTTTGHRSRVSDRERERGSSTERRSARTRERRRETSPSPEVRSSKREEHDRDRLQKRLGKHNNLRSDSDRESSPRLRTERPQRHRDDNDDNHSDIDVRSKAINSGKDNHKSSPDVVSDRKRTPEKRQRHAGEREKSPRQRHAGEKEREKSPRQCHAGEKEREKSPRQRHAGEKEREKSPQILDLREKLRRKKLKSQQNDQKDDVCTLKSKDISVHVTVGNEEEVSIKKRKHSDNVDEGHLNSSKSDHVITATCTGDEGKVSPPPLKRYRPTLQGKKPNAESLKSDLDFLQSLKQSLKSTAKSSEDLSNKKDSSVKSSVEESLHSKSERLMNEDDDRATDIERERWKKILSSKSSSGSESTNKLTEISMVDTSESVITGQTSVIELQSDMPATAAEIEDEKISFSKLMTSDQTPVDGNSTVTSQNNDDTDILYSGIDGDVCMDDSRVDENDFDVELFKLGTDREASDIDSTSSSDTGEDKVCNTGEDKVCNTGEDKVVEGNHSANTDLTDLSPAGSSSVKHCTTAAASEQTTRGLLRDIALSTTDINSDLPECRKCGKESGDMVGCCSVPQESVNNYMSGRKKRWVKKKPLSNSSVCSSSDEDETISVESVDKRAVERALVAPKDLPKDEHSLQVSVAGVAEGQKVEYCCLKSPTDESSLLYKFFRRPKSVDQVTEPRPKASERKTGRSKSAEELVTEKNDFPSVSIQKTSIGQNVSGLRRRSRDKSKERVSPDEQRVTVEKVVTTKSDKLETLVKSGSEEETNEETVLLSATDQNIVRDAEDGQLLDKGLGNQSAEVSSNQSTEVSSNQSAEVSGNQSTKVSGNRCSEVNAKSGCVGQRGLNNSSNKDEPIHMSTPSISNSRLKEDKESRGHLLNSLSDCTPDERQIQMPNSPSHSERPSKSDDEQEDCLMSGEHGSSSESTEFSSEGKDNAVESENDTGLYFSSSDETGPQLKSKSSFSTNSEEECIDSGESAESETSTDQVEVQMIKTIDEELNETSEEMREHEECEKTSKMKTSDKQTEKTKSVELIQSETTSALSKKSENEVSSLMKSTGKCSDDSKTVQGTDSSVALSDSLAINLTTETSCKDKDSVENEISCNLSNAKEKVNENIGMKFTDIDNVGCKPETSNKDNNSEAGMKASEEKKAVGKRTRVLQSLLESVACLMEQTSPEADDRTNYFAVCSSDENGSYIGDAEVQTSFKTATDTKINPKVEVKSSECEQKPPGSSSRCLKNVSGNISQKSALKCGNTNEDKTLEPIQKVSSPKTFDEDIVVESTKQRQVLSPLGTGVKESIVYVTAFEQPVILKTALPYLSPGKGKNNPFINHDRQLHFKVDEKTHETRKTRLSQAGLAKSPDTPYLIDNKEVVQVKRGSKSQTSLSDASSDVEMMVDNFDYQRYLKRDVKKIKLGPRLSPRKNVSGLQKARLLTSDDDQSEFSEQGTPLRHSPRKEVTAASNHSLNTKASDTKNIKERRRQTRRQTDTPESSTYSVQKDSVQPTTADESPTCLMFIDGKFRRTPKMAKVQPVIELSDSETSNMSTTPEVDSEKDRQKEETSPITDTDCDSALKSTPVLRRSPRKRVMKLHRNLSKSLKHASVSSSVSSSSVSTISKVSSTSNVSTSRSVSSSSVSASSSVSSTSNVSTSSVSSSNVSLLRRSPRKRVPVVCQQKVNITTDNEAVKDKKSDHTLGSKLSETLLNDSPSKRTRSLTKIHTESVSTVTEPSTDETTDKPVDEHCQSKEINRVNKSQRNLFQTDRNSSGSNQSSYRNSTCKAHSSQGLTSKVEGKVVHNKMDSSKYDIDDSDTKEKDELDKKKLPTTDSQRSSSITTKATSKQDLDKQSADKPKTKRVGLITGDKDVGETKSAAPVKAAVKLSKCGTDTLSQSGSLSPSKSTSKATVKVGHGGKPRTRSKSRENIHDETKTVPDSVSKATPVQDNIHKELLKTTLTNTTNDENISANKSHSTASVQPQQLQRHQSRKASTRQSVELQKTDNKKKKESFEDTLFNYESEILKLPEKRSNRSRSGIAPLSSGVDNVSMKTEKVSSKSERAKNVEKLSSKSEKPSSKTKEIRKPQSASNSPCRKGTMISESKAKDKYMDLHKDGKEVTGRQVGPPPSGSRPRSRSKVQASDKKSNLRGDQVKKQHVLSDSLSCSSGDGSGSSDSESETEILRQIYSESSPINNRIQKYFDEENKGKKGHSGSSKISDIGRTEPEPNRELATAEGQIHNSIKREINRRGSKKKTENMDSSKKVLGAQNEKGKVNESNTVGSTKHVHRDDNTKKAHQTGSTKKAYQADGTKKAHQAASTEKAHQADQTKKAHQADQTKKAHQADQTKKAHQAASTTIAHQADPTKKAHQADQTKKAHQAASTKIAHQADQTKKAHQADQTKKAHQAASTTIAHQADPTKKVHQAASSKKAHQAASSKKTLRDNSRETESLDRKQMKSNAVHHSTKRKLSCDTINTVDSVDSTNSTTSIDIKKRKHSRDNTKRNIHTDSQSRTHIDDSKRWKRNEDRTNANDRVDSSVCTERSTIDSPRRRDCVDSPRRRDSIDSPRRRDSIDSPRRRDSIDSPRRRDIIVDSPRRRDSIDSPRRRDSIDSPRRDSIDSPRRRDSIDSPRRRDRIDSPRRRDSIDSPRRRDSIVDSTMRRDSIDITHSREQSNSIESLKRKDSTDITKRGKPIHNTRRRDSNEQNAITVIAEIHHSGCSDNIDSMHNKSRVQSSRTVDAKECADSKMRKYNVDRSKLGSHGNSKRSIHDNRKRGSHDNSGSENSGSHISNMTDGDHSSFSKNIFGGEITGSHSGNDTKTEEQENVDASKRSHHESSGVMQRRSSSGRSKLRQTNSNNREDGLDGRRKIQDESYRNKDRSCISSRKETKENGEDQIEICEGSRDLNKRSTTGHRTPASTVKELGIEQSGTCPVAVQSDSDTRESVDTETTKLYGESEEMICSDSNNSFLLSPVHVEKVSLKKRREELLNSSSSTSSDSEHSTLVNSPDMAADSDDEITLQRNNGERITRKHKGHRYDTVKNNISPQGSSLKETRKQPDKPRGINTSRNNLSANSKDDTIPARNTKHTRHKIHKQTSYSSLELYTDNNTDSGVRGSGLVGWKKNSRENDKTFPTDSSSYREENPERTTSRTENHKKHEHSTHASAIYSENSTGSDSNDSHAESNESDNGSDNQAKSYDSDNGSYRSAESDNGSDSQAESDDSDGQQIRESNSYNSEVISKSPARDNQDCVYLLGAEETLDGVRYSSYKTDGDDRRNSTSNSDGYDSTDPEEGEPQDGVCYGEDESWDSASNSDGGNINLEEGELESDEDDVNLVQDDSIKPTLSEKLDKKKKVFSPVKYQRENLHSSMISESERENRGRKRGPSKSVEHRSKPSFQPRRAENRSRERRGSKQVVPLETFRKETRRSGRDFVNNDIVSNRCQISRADTRGSHSRNTFKNAFSRRQADEKTHRHGSGEVLPRHTRSSTRASSPSCSRRPSSGSKHFSSSNTRYSSVQSRSLSIQTTPDTRFHHRVDNSSERRRSSDTRKRSRTRSKSPTPHKRRKEDLASRRVLEPESSHSRRHSRMENEIVSSKPRLSSKEARTPCNPATSSQEPKSKTRSKRPSDRPKRDMV